MLFKESKEKLVIGSKTFSAVALLLSVAVMSVSCAQTPSTGTGDFSQSIHEAVINQMPGYNEKIRGRALATCINWTNSTRNDLDIQTAMYYYTGVGSDTDIFTSRLMNLALSECNRKRSNRGLDCECVPFDKNGVFVLKPPSDFN